MVNLSILKLHLKSCCLENTCSVVIVQYFGTFPIDSGLFCLNIKYIANCVLLLPSDVFL